MNAPLTITDRVLQADQLAVERFLRAARQATRHHGTDALLADMLDHMIAYYEGDEDDKAYSAGEMRDTAYTLEQCALDQQAETEHPYGDGIKLRRTWP